MIQTVASAMVSRLEGLDIFRAVERGVGGKILQTPPAAAVILNDEKEAENSPVVRELGFDVVLSIPAMGSDKGHDAADDIIDAVRNVFVDQVLLPSGGVTPAKVPFIRLEGMERNLLIYTARVTMQAMPAVIDKNMQPGCRRKKL